MDTPRLLIQQNPEYGEIVTSSLNQKNHLKVPGYHHPFNPNYISTLQGFNIHEHPHFKGAPHPHELPTRNSQKGIWIGISPDLFQHPTIVHPDTMSSYPFSSILRAPV